MSYCVKEIEGIGQSVADKLNKAGITTTADLLAHCGSAKGRKDIAGASGLDEKRLLKWTNAADLMRITGIGSEFSELLEAAGVDTVKELRTRNAANLAAKVAEVNGEKKLTRRVPNETVVAGWIEQAKSLDPCITY
jgi:predicted flap endonuclease-1-like 5' DNA nuclease